MLGLLDHQDWMFAFLQGFLQNRSKRRPAGCSSIVRFLNLLSRPVPPATKDNPRGRLGMPRVGLVPNDKPGMPLGQSVL